MEGLDIFFPPVFGFGNFLGFLFLGGWCFRGVFPPSMASVLQDWQFQEGMRKGAKEE
jgi:hypothetical protein